MLIVDVKTKIKPGKHCEKRIIVQLTFKSNTNQNCHSNNYSNDYFCFNHALLYFLFKSGGAKMKKLTFDILYSISALIFWYVSNNLFIMVYWATFG